MVSKMFKTAQLDAFRIAAALYFLWPCELKSLNFRGKYMGVVEKTATVVRYLLLPRNKWKLVISKIVSLN